MPTTLTTPEKYKSFNERWDWIVTFMVLEDMFVHEILMLMEKKPTSSIPTMGVAVVNSRLIFLYNPEFVGQLSDPELRYVVTHEIYHVALHHCTVRLPEDESERSLWNQAADLAINSLIPEDSNRHMPKAKELEGMKPEKFGFEPKLSMEQYLQLLRENPNGKPGSEMEKQGGAGEGFDDHNGWRESELAKQIIRNHIEKMSHSDRAWGNMPGDIKAMILAAQRSKVSWRKYLRQYFGNLITTNHQSTFKKPNKRFGYPYSGTKRLHTDRKLVAIDTSGSVGDKELSQFLTEVNKLAEIQPVDLQLFDHELQGKVQPFEKKHANFKFTGRGGTCFEPVMELAEKRKYHSLIMLTDGEAAAPERPRGVKDILWVIVGGSKPPVDWGTVIHISTD